MVGAVGSDSYGDEYLQQLQLEGVDCQFIKRSDQFGTGTASIQVGGSGENTIIIVRGANFDVTLTDDASMEDIVALSNVVVCQNEIPITTTRAVLSLCNHHKTLCILNPAPVSAELIELVPLCDIICPNEVELAALTALPASSEEEISVAVRKLLELGCRGVVVTLGSKGACYATKGSDVQFVAAETVLAIDSVGAGDSFIGEKEGTERRLRTEDYYCFSRVTSALLATNAAAVGTLACNLSRSVPLPVSIERAVHCASLSVTRTGAQSSYPRLSDIEGSKYAPPALVDGLVVERSLVYINGTS